MIPAFHDYPLEPKLTKCGDLLNQNHVNLSFLKFYFHIAPCPLDYPFAYLNGGYCCKTNKERPVELGITPQNEIDDGTCDGVDFNRQSKCCKSENTPCPHGSVCFDNSVGK